MIIEQPAKWLRWIYPKAFWRMDRPEKAVYLTFDDGKHPELYERIVSEGHQVGNHTHNHISGIRHSLHDYSYNVEKANAYIHSHYVRPPHGWMRLPQYAWLSRKYKIVMWDLVTRDYSKWLTAEDVFNNVKRYARNGSIITFHDSLKSIDKLKTALPQAIEWLKKEGYAFKIFE